MQVAITKNEIASLKEGDKITYVVMNGFGFVQVRHARFKRSEIKRNGWGTEWLAMYYTLKGERKTRGTAFSDGGITIGLGWQDIQTPSIDGETCFNNETCADVVAKLEDVVFAC